jgi:hypothetical protein
LYQKRDDTYRKIPGTSLSNRAFTVDDVNDVVYDNIIAQWEKNGIPTALKEPILHGNIFVFDNIEAKNRGEVGKVASVEDIAFYIRQKLKNKVQPVFEKFKRERDMITIEDDDEDESKELG